MRPNSKAASALALILAGLLARTTFAHPVCSSDVSCPPSLEERQVGDVEQWHGDLVARAGSPRLGSKRPPSEEDLNAPAKRPDTDDPNFDPEGEQSGAVSGPAWGQSSNPPSRAPDESTGPVPAGRPTGGDTGTIPADDVSAVSNVESKGYIVAKQDQKDGNDDVFLINSKTRNDDPNDLGVYVAKIRTNKEEGSITVDDARLKKVEDTPERPGHPGDPKGEADRARLWEMQATVAVHKSGMKPGDIKMLRSEQVEETRSEDVVGRSRTKMGEQDFEVKSDSTGVEKEVFDDNLQNSGFGKNAQAFLANVPTGKQVKEIHVGPGSTDDDFSYTFVLG